MMIKHLSILVDNFPGAPNQTWCFAHILNLVTKSILHQFDVAKNSRPVDSELDDATKELVVLAQRWWGRGREWQWWWWWWAGWRPMWHVQGGIGWFAGKSWANLVDADKGELIFKFNSQFAYCAQLWALANAIKNSSTILLPHWNALLEDLGLRVWMMPLEFHIRYVGFHDQLPFSHQRDDFQSWTQSLEVWVGRWQVGSCSKPTWYVEGRSWLYIVLLIILIDCLQIFKHTTLFFSCDTLGISTTIPAMDHIDTHLATATHNVEYSASICAVLALGKHTLNRYYNKMDHSEVYRIAMDKCSQSSHRCYWRFHSSSSLP